MKIKKNWIIGSGMCMGKIPYSFWVAKWISHHLIAGLFVFFALLPGLFPVSEATAAKKASLSSSEIIVIVGENTTLKVRNTKKTVRWSILSGKKYITLKKKSKVAVTVEGRKEGTAEIQAAIGKQKLTCMVDVENVVEDNVPSPVILSNVPEGADEQDAEALKKLVSEQLEQGASVSPDLSSEEYTWENGRLTQLHWERKNLLGDLDVSGCIHLAYLNCAETALKLRWAIWMSAAVWD